MPAPRPTHSCAQTLNQPPGLPGIPSSTDHKINEALEGLFAETIALANHFKKAAAALHQQERLPAGGAGVLQALAELGARSVAQIARIRSSSRQNIQMTVNRLQKHGWVEFQENPAHKRSDLVALTEQGRQLIAAAQERQRQHLQNLLAGFSRREIAAATHLLRQLRELIPIPRGLPLHKPEPAEAITRAERQPADYLDELPVSLL